MGKQTYKPLMGGKFGDLIRSIKNSPYPLHYTIRWPYYFRNPSIKNHDNITISPQEKTIKTKAVASKVKIVFGGDIMVLNGDIIPELSPQLTQLIGKADLFAANCEALVGNHDCNPDKKYALIFQMPRSFLEGIINQIPLSPDKILLSNANNHSGDVDKQTFHDSINILKEMGIKVLGENTPSTRVYKHDINGISLGFSAWTHWENCRIFKDTDKLLTYNHIKDTNFNAYKDDNNLDFLIGLPHWEYEFQHYPGRKTRTTGKSIIDSGFDLIMGSHTHVMQPFEFHNDKLCVYNLGNFCGLGVAWSVKIIPILEVDLIKDIEGKVELQHYKVHFFYQQHLPNRVKISTFDELDETTRNKALERLKVLTQLND